MTDQEKADLLERGRERCLNILEKLFEEARQESNLTLANSWYHKYDGAVKMLESLGLISWEESHSITDALWRRFRATRDPEEVQ